MKKSVLITGGSGLLAINWALATRDEYDVTLLLHQRVISLKGVQTKIAPIDSLVNCESILDMYHPDIVIHAAGLTNVEECEKYPELAQLINVDLAKYMAISCNARGIQLVHISSDHLFSGDEIIATEESNTSPVNHYAKSKLKGECKIQKYCKDALIIRTNFFGWGTRYRHSFSDFIINKLRNNETVDLFSDVFFTTILVSELSKITHLSINKNLSGIFNVVGGDRLSKYEFGIRLADCFDLNVNLINKIKIKEKVNLVKRPKNMSLSNNKVCKALNCTVPSIDDQLQMLKLQESNNAISQVLILT